MTEVRLRDEMCALGRSLFERGLTSGASGNLSARLDDGFLFTPTGASLGALDPARLSRLDAAGALVSGDPPSKEAFLHRGMYEGRPAARAIVHLHSTHATAVSCLAGLPPADCIPPLTPYFVMKVGRLPLVPYHRPGDPGLGELVRGLAARHAAVLLANHGPVVSGGSLEAAVQAAEELEETAKLFLLLREMSPRALTPEQIEELRIVFRLDL
jgi:ribulose-5-phosphate 4-epimerase/fuculose-1-phosphate aldolase